MFGFKKLLETVIKEKNIEIKRLIKQNNQLMDRLMATNFQELKEFTPEQGSAEPMIYNPEVDEDNAGEFLSEQDLQTIDFNQVRDTKP